MTTLELATLDLSLYQSTPMLTAEGTYRLALDLAEAKPEPAPELIDKRVLQMLVTSERMSDAMVAKVAAKRGGGRRDVDFDGLADRLWSATRAELEYRMLWAEPGVVLLSDAEAEALELERRRADAELARELYEHLFGDGVSFAVRPFSEQATAMATRLAFITSSPKAARYTALIGAERLAALRVVQGRYEAMVHERATRSDEREDVGALRLVLQRQISLYAGAVLGLLDEHDPSSIAQVRAALQPMVNARRGRSGSRPKPEVAFDGGAAGAEDSP
jgi:hypothetical protein